MGIIARIVIVTLALTSTGCVFSKLGDDLARLEKEAHLFAGFVASDVLQFHSTVVVALDDPQANRIESFRMLSGEGVFEIRRPKEPTWFFAFADLNKDLRFQTNEPYGWAANGEAVVPHEPETRHVDIRIGAAGQAPYPQNLVSEPLELHLRNYARTHIGSVSSLDNPLFSAAQGRKGLWEPFAFWEDGGTGLHFLHPYDEDKIPVLFIHGINASPQDFTSLIAALDLSRFQPWVVSYPSGLRLSWLARGTFQFIEVLHRRYGFDELHIVAHSMGGLVTRGALNLCTKNRTCDYVASFTSISTPWDGVASAASGVKWAPTVVPVWNDLYPESEYLSTLFDTPLPEDVPHNLIFGFRQDSIFGSGSSDGVIDLSSQLRDAAQEQAVGIRGFDESHVGILHSDAVIGNVFRLLDQAAR
jgi:pimeloyl-ACP methyl ester carboxylesterase